MFLKHSELISKCSVAIWLLSLISTLGLGALIGACRGDGFSIPLILNQRLAYMDICLGIPILVLFLYSHLFRKRNCRVSVPYRPRSLLHGRLLSVLFQTLCKFALSFGCILATSASFCLLYHGLVWNGPRILAYCADLTGDYEFGESIFRWVPSSDDAKYLAMDVSYSHDRKTKELKSDRLNRTVAAIYGPESLQMAHRYLTLGLHYNAYFEDYRSEEKYLKMALNLYKHHNDCSNSAIVLGWLSFAQLQNGSERQCKQSITEALALLPYCSDEAISSTCNELYCTVWEMGDHEQASRIIKLIPKKS